MTREPKKKIKKEPTHSPREIELGHDLLPDGITMEMLRSNWDICKEQYGKIYKRWRLLDQVDSGEMWTTLCKKFPQYQIAPDTNHVNYIKENILASIYTVGKGANVVPRNPEDEDLITAINLVMDTIWDILEVPAYQQKAGERAALLNLGVTQVGWNQDLVGGTHHSWYKGDVVMKNVNPMSYFRDPFSNSLDEAAYVIQHEKHPLVNLKANKIYAERLKHYKPGDVALGTIEGVDEFHRDTVSESENQGKNPRLIIHWVKVNDDTKKGYHISEIHTLNNEFVLNVIEELDIGMFPFAELYCNEPGSDLIGVSEPAKILSSSMVANILDGIIATHAYKAQRPPKFINVSSGINVRHFAKRGNDPDTTWIVSSNAKDAVHYQDFPALPKEAFELTSKLDNAIKSVTGIDDRYAGKDSGSVQTTGGIESMLAQSTLRDATKINLYETYSRRLSRLVLKHLIVHGDKRAYTYKDTLGTFKAIEFDFPEIDDSIEFSYAINISNQLPKNKMMLSQSADAIMEKSLQYADPSGQTPPLMEPEEWLKFKEFPQKDLMLNRMKIQRQASTEEEFAQGLTAFATFLGNGMEPGEAFDLTIEMMSSGQLQEEAAGIGSVGNEAGPGGFGNIQDRQQG